jgi:hypothetical protein
LIVACGLFIENMDSTVMGLRCPRSRATMVDPIALKPR